MFSIRCTAAHTPLPSPKPSRQPNLRSSHSEPQSKLKVTVIGAAGGVGQPLCLLLKLNPQIKQLSLHDVVNLKGIAADLSHISSATKVKSFEGAEELPMALAEADIIVMAAAAVTTEIDSTDDSFNRNAKIAIDTAKTIAHAAPDAFLTVATNPINSIVPIMARVLQDANAYDARRLFGITMLDVVRANAILAEVLQVNPLKVSVPVIGGSGSGRMLPLVSQTSPAFRGSKEQRLELMQRMRAAEVELKKAKSGKDSTLGMAYATAQFVNSLILALHNTKHIVECAFVQSDVNELDFFATPLLLTAVGVKQNLGLPEFDDEEGKAYEQLLKKVKQDIARGLAPLD